MSTSSTEQDRSLLARGPAPPPPERSVGELLAELASESRTLVKQEMKLAAAEMTHKAAYAGKQGALVGVGALLGLVSVLALVGALVAGLATVMELWLSALLVGIAIGAVAGGVTAKGIVALRRMDLAPTQTIESMQANKAWIKEQVR